MQKKCYLTALSTDSYLMGVLILAESLKAVKSEYPLRCLAIDNLKPETYKTLENFGIEYIIRKPEFNLDNELIEANNRNGSNNWTHTFFKFEMFDVPYEKIVYLDADTVVIQNIDELFDKSHLTACKDSDLFPPYSELCYHHGFNSGVLVIEPDKEIKERAVQVINGFKWHGGDQQIFEHLYPDWRSQSELRLPRNYNVFTAEAWIKFCFKDMPLNGENGIKVLHMVWFKPWFDIEQQHRWIDTQLTRKLFCIEDFRYINCLEIYKKYETEVIKKLLN
jgi:alpha-N-acetylglucosamine transferase